MKLWMETFHDSPEYVNLLFDAYFSEEHIEYEICDGKLVAAMLAIPYHFEYRLTVSAGGETDLIDFNALYLCGLATRPGYRNKGIMGRLIEQIASRAKHSKKYDFLFLIPADNHLANYYMSKGFVPFCNRNIIDLNRNMQTNNNCINSSNNSNMDYLDVNEYALKNEINRENSVHTNRQLECGILNFNNSSECQILIEFLVKNQFDFRNGLLKLVHSERDFSIAIEECKIAGGGIYYCKSSEKINGVAFTYNYGDEVRVYALIHESGCPEFIHGIKNIILDFIAENNNGKKIRMNIYSDYVRDGEIYGMLQNLHKNENLKFSAACRGDLKYSILAKEGLRGEIALMLD